MYEFSPDAEFTLEQVKLRRVSYRLCCLAGRPPLPGMEAEWDIPPFLKISRTFVESISSRTDNLDFGEYSMEYLVDIVLFLGLEKETCLMQHVGDRRGLAKALSSFLRGRAQLLEGIITSVPALSGSGVTTIAGAGRSRSKKGRSRSGKISRSRSGKISVGAGNSAGSSDKRRRVNPSSAVSDAGHGAQTRAPLLGSGAGGKQLRVTRKRKAEADASSFLAVDEETIGGFHVSGEGGDIMARPLVATSASRAGHGGRESVAQGCTSEATALGYPAAKVRRPRTQAKDPSAPAYADMISKAFSELGKTHATHSELCGVIEERYAGLLSDDRDPYERCPRWRTCIRKVLQGNDRFGVEGSQGVKRLYSLLG